MDGRRFVQFSLNIQFVTGMEIIVLVFRKLSSSSCLYLVNAALSYFCFGVYLMTLSVAQAI